MTIGDVMIHFKYASSLQAHCRCRRVQGRWKGRPCAGWPLPVKWLVKESKRKSFVHSFDRQLIDRIHSVQGTNTNRDLNAWNSGISWNIRAALVWGKSFFKRQSFYCRLRLGYIFPSWNKIKIEIETHPDKFDDQISLGKTILVSIESYSWHYIPTKLAHLHNSYSITKIMQA